MFNAKLFVLVAVALCLVQSCTINEPEEVPCNSGKPEGSSCGTVKTCGCGKPEGSSCGAIKTGGCGCKPCRCGCSCRSCSNVD
ncbi:hypothetical protein KR074_001251 [Drosophila pseudoananassae]|nr:hypothetical protein KR074_001251 [Drosophila pseudoananassae]